MGKCMVRKLLLMLVVLVMMAGCVKPVPPAQPPVVVPTVAQPPEQLPTEPPSGLDPRCPVSCDDQNKCTQDVCNLQTSFECRTIPIVPCCGNGVCETAESSESCSQDCTQQSAEFKQLIANSGKVETYSYRYEYYDVEALKTTYVVRMAGPYTLLDYDNLHNRGTFAYNHVFINTTDNTTTLYCERSCGVQTTAMAIKDTSAFIQRRPVETLQSLSGVTVVGKENVEGKQVTVLTKKNTDGTTLRIKVWEFFGTPMVEEVLDVNSNVLSRVRYKNLEVNTLSQSDLSLPKGIVYK